MLTKINLAVQKTYLGLLTAQLHKLLKYKGLTLLHILDLLATITYTARHYAVYARSCVVVISRGEEDQRENEAIQRGVILVLLGFEHINVYVVYVPVIVINQNFIGKLQFSDDHPNEVENSGLVQKRHFKYVHDPALSQLYLEKRNLEPVHYFSEKSIVEIVVALVLMNPPCWP